MKIVYHHRTRGSGVEAVHIGEIVKGFRLLGHQVDIISPPGVSVKGIDKPNNSKKISGIFNVFSKAMPEIFFEIMEIVYNLKSLSNFKKSFEITNYDCIFERYAIFSITGVLYARRKKIPIIMEVNYTSYSPLARKRSHIMKPLAHLFDRWIFRNVDGFVVVSTLLKEQLINLGVDGNKIIVVTNAADPDVFSPNVSGSQVREDLGLGKNIVIGYVGGFYEWHGLDFIIDVLKKLSDNFKDVKLLLVGDGPKKESLKARISELGLDSYVVFSGNISHENLPRYISAFDIAILPDSNDYCSPMKVFEYMSAGKPVVAPDLRNLRESFTHGEHGLLFAPMNEQSLLDSLKSLISDSDFRIRMGNEGRRHIIKNHTWQINCAEIIKLYDMVVKVKH